MRRISTYVDPTVGTSISLSHYDDSGGLGVNNNINNNNNNNSILDENDEATSVFTTQVNLLGIPISQFSHYRDTEENEEENNNFSGIPPQQRHVVYEYYNSAFVSSDLHKELAAKDNEVRERAQIEETRQRLANNLNNKKSLRNSTIQRIGGNNIECAENFRSLIQKVLKYMHKIEITFKAFAAGMSFMSLLAIRMKINYEKILDDNYVLLYISIISSFDAAVFLFFFLLLLITSIAPLVTGIADKQWRESKRKQFRRNIENNEQNQLQNQIKQRRRTENNIKTTPGVRFMQSEGDGTEVNIVAPFSSSEIMRRKSSNITEGLHSTGASFRVGEIEELVSSSNVPFASFQTPPTTNTNMKYANLNTGVKYNRNNNNNNKHVGRRFSQGKKYLTGRLLGKTNNISNNPWRVLLTPTIWIYIIGLVLTVVEIACTEERSSQVILTLKDNGHSATAELLLAILYIRVSILLIVLLLEFF